MEFGLGFIYIVVFCFYLFSKKAVLLLCALFCPPALLGYFLMLTLVAELRLFCGRIGEAV